jgi:hypothetical protein
MQQMSESAEHRDGKTSEMDECAENGGNVRRRKMMGSEKTENAENGEW